MINLAWGGLTNGDISTSLLVDVSGRGDYCEPTAAAQFLRMQAAIKEAVGFDLQPASGSSAYRPESIQVTFFTQRYTRVSYNTGLWWNGAYWKKDAGASTAAIPKTSNHGWGRAIDLNISRYDVAAWAWMQAHAHEYGYDWATGKTSGEDWHWECLTPPGTVVAGLGSKTIIEKDEVDDMKTCLNKETGTVFAVGPGRYYPFGKVTGTTMNSYRAVAKVFGEYVELTNAESIEVIHACCGQIDLTKPYIA